MRLIEDLNSINDYLEHLNCNFHPEESKLGKKILMIKRLGFWNLKSELKMVRFKLVSSFEASHFLFFKVAKPSNVPSKMVYPAIHVESWRSAKAINNAGLFWRPIKQLAALMSRHGVTTEKEKTVLPISSIDCCPYASMVVMLLFSVYSK